MSLDLFRVSHGLDILSDDYSSNIYVLQGSGAPGGDTGIQDAAPKGSVYTDIATGILYLKITAGTGTDKWEAQASQTYVTDAIAVLGNAFNYVGTTAGGVDSGSATDLTALPAGGKDAGDYYKVTTAGYFNDGTNTFYANVNDGLVWNTTGAVDIIDNTNSTVSGTTNFISVSGDADTGYTVDVDTNFKDRVTALETEQDFIQSFVGKTADGSETPTYSSATQVTQSANLETAIGELDAIIGTDVTSDDIITAGDTVHENIAAISTYILNQDQVTEFTSVTSGADTVTGTTAKWVVRVSETATPANTTAYEVIAMTDGTNVDFTRYAILRSGSNIVGLTTAVTTTGSDLTLTITSTPNVDIKIKRVAAM